MGEVITLRARRDHVQRVTEAVAACSMYENIVIVQRSSIRKGHPYRWFVTKRTFASSAENADHVDLFELPDHQSALDVCTIEGVCASWVPFGKRSNG